MAYKITDGCIGCGACEGTCPVGAISNDGSVCVIDADTCIECGACAGACPTVIVLIDNPLKHQPLLLTQQPAFGRC